MALRELPCPYRIVDDFGGAFSMGGFAGCILYFIRGIPISNIFYQGMWYSPKKERLFGGVMLLKKRAPILGGSFALWGGLFSSTDCLLIHLRNKEDYWNPIAAGFVTGAGTRIAFRNAIFGGIILGCIQMVEIGMIKWQMKKEMEFYHKMQEEEINKQKQMIMEKRPGQGGPQMSTY